MDGWTCPNYTKNFNKSELHFLTVSLHFYQQLLEYIYYQIRKSVVLICLCYTGQFIPFLKRLQQKALIFEKRNMFKLLSYRYQIHIIL